MKLFVPCLRPLGPEPRESDILRARIPVMVADGFSWRVLVFGWLGLLSFGAWISALFAAAFGMAVLHVLHGFGLKVGFVISFHAVLATFASDIRLWELRLNGWTPGAPVAAPSRDIALLRWVDRQSEVPPDDASPLSNASPLNRPPELPCASS